jgi:hypothetical protein
VLCAVESARVAIEGDARWLSGVVALLKLIVGHVAEAIDPIADDLSTELDEAEDCPTRRDIAPECQKLAAVRRSGSACIASYRECAPSFEHQCADGIERPLQASSRWSPGSSETSIPNRSFHANRRSG